MSELNLSSGSSPSLEETILELNARLNSQRASYAEHAFGVGFRAAVVPSLLVIGLAFLLGARGWAALFLIATTTVLLAFVLVSLFTNQAQKNAARRIFHEEIEPALEGCQEQYQQSMEDIAAMAAAVLPADAVLRAFLPLSDVNSEPILDEPPASSTGGL